MISTEHEKKIGIRFENKNRDPIAKKKHAAIEQ